MLSPRPALLFCPAAVLLLAVGCSGSERATSRASPSAVPGTTLSAAPSPTPSDEDPLSPKPAVESAAPLGQPLCDPRVVTLTDADAVITDVVEEIYVLRTSGPPCQLQGFPAVTLLDGQGRGLGVTVTRTGARPLPLTLSKATSLSITLTTGRTGSCQPVASVRVVLPGTRSPLQAPTELRACGGVTTSPVQRLQDDEDEGAHG